MLVGMTAPGLRLSRSLRRALSLLLAAVLALSPLVSTAAQTHEAAHAAQGDEHFHAHDHARDARAGSEAGTVVHDEAGHADGMPDSGGALHLLAHAAHACGHSVAILGAVLIAPMAGAHDDILSDLYSTPADAPRAHPFRPPIG